MATAICTPNANKLYALLRIVRKALIAGAYTAIGASPTQLRRNCKVKRRA